MVTVFYIATPRAYKEQFTEDPPEIPFWSRSHKLTFDNCEGFWLYATMEEAKMNFRKFAEKFRNDKAYIGTININPGELYELITDIAPVKRAFKEEQVKELEKI